MGNSSSRPASISKISTHLLKSLKKLKLQVGPTWFRPGPMLLIVAATAVKLVTRSRPSKDSRKRDSANTVVKAIKYTLVDRTTSCSMGLPSILIFLMLLGWI